MQNADVVQRQLEAYNAKDLDGWLCTHHVDAKHYALPGELLAVGHRALEERMTIRFAEPDLHAELLSRTVMDDIVLDHKRITRNFTGGIGTVEMLAIYQVRSGRITRATFALRNERLLPARATKVLEEARGETASSVTGSDRINKK